MIRLALAQINPVVGDLPGNAGQVLDAARRASEAGADLVLFPELALTGYPPEDLLFHADFLKDAARALADVARRLPRGLAAVVGAPSGKPGALFNAAAVLSGGRVRALYRKQLLPNYGVFDEKRYFLPGKDPLVFPVKGLRVGVTVCEDIWFPGPAAQAKKKGAAFLINLSSSPFHAGKQALREKAARARVKETGLPLAYCNLVGGQDELVFDGASFLMDARGRVAARAPQFQEHLLLADVPGNGPVADLLPPLDEVHAALVLGVRDYVRKSGFQKVVIGLSGGIDSALVAALAVEALGRENVIGATLPTRFNAAATKADAARLAENLGIAFHSLPIEDAFQAFLKTLQPAFAGLPADLTEENLQSRIRGVALMALSNKLGALVLTTGNKSETSVGYTTLYGDTAGAFAPIKDIPKNQVYALSRRVNEKAGEELIPQSVFTRAPSAELRENQTDQDTLPPYDRLDKAVRLYVEENRGLPELLRAGFPREEALRLLRLIDMNEYKRRQSPPGPKITPRAFGRDRRMPIVNRRRHG